jgi:hypothetical protein
MVSECRFYVIFIDTHHQRNPQNVSNPNRVIIIIAIVVVVITCGL